MSREDKFDLCLDERVYSATGFERYVTWQPPKTSHLLLTGQTGSGKTVLTKNLLAKIGKYSRGKLILADYKGMDFRFAASADGHYQYLETEFAIDRVHKILMERQAGAPSTQPIYFCLEEWSGYLQLLKKSQAEEAKAKVGNILALGRGFRIFIILTLQRPDSQFFPNGGRENFPSTVWLGRMSKEGATMCFNEVKEEIDFSFGGRGTGWAMMGSKLFPVRVPLPKDEREAERYIIDALSR